MDGFLTSAEAAKRLGVKLPTLYVYVSRGLIAAVRAPDGKHSLFAVEEVEALARRSRRDRPTETRLATIATQVTQITPAGPLYRGVPAVSLVERPFEEVAELLWQRSVKDWKPCRVRSLRGLPAKDQIRATVALVAASDPFRSDRRAEAVIDAAARLIATIVSCIAGTAGGTESVAERLATWISPDGASDAMRRAVNAVMVLLTDHEIATSTLGVRLAASTRADLYDAVLAGLGVVGGPLHGGNSELVYALLERAAGLGVERALDEELRWHSRPPGFGVVVYEERDPRFDAMKPFLDDLLASRDREVLDHLLEVVRERGFPAPTIDVALAAIVWAQRADPSCGPALFSIARIPGWTAHYLEELAEKAVRFRARAVYVSPDKEMALGEG